MAWNIVSKEDTSKYIRLPVNQLEDLWYEMSLGLIEQYTGWEGLEEDAEAITETLDGTGMSYLPTRTPLVSLSALSVFGVTMPTSYYDVRWDGLYLKTYRPVQSVISNTSWFDTFTNFGAIFPFGTSNVEATYAYGSYLTLPKDLQRSLKAVMMMVIREFTVVTRNEGSDATLKVFKAGLHGAEALKVAGTHGKCVGIMQAFLPARNRFL